jgi:hypothetical protein
MQKILCDCYIIGRDSAGKCVPGTQYYAGGYSKNFDPKNPTSFAPASAGYEFLSDECVVIKLADLREPGSCGTFQDKHWKTLKAKQRCRKRKGNTFGCHDNNPLAGDCRANRASAFVIIDKDCNYVPNTPASEICGNYKAITSWSPISLVWTEGAQRTRHLASFPINPHQKGTYYTWEASVDMPLLAFDPEHTGIVSSGAQLFGNWTWGGKRQASLAPEPTTDGAWAHGFEALSQLDADHNGKVDGSELEPLALWFDRNSDGISQPGEVVPVKDENVTALFYTIDTDQPREHELWASVGFERIVDGAVVTGGAVDWFAQEAKSTVELALRQQMDNVANLPSRNYLDDLLEQQPPAPYASLVGQDKFAGAWKWAVRDSAKVKGGVSAGGTLMLITNEGDSEVTGMSMIELPLEGGTAEEPRRLLAHSPISGSFEFKDGQLGLTFSVLDEDKTLAVSKVTVSDDGNTLRGTTTTGATEGGIPLTYEWEATRE